MYRDTKIYIDDILQSINKILEYTNSLTFEKFCNSDIVFDAVIRRFEIIGEAANQIKKADNKFYQKYPEIEWRELIDFRNILIHGYFGIIEEIVWGVIKNKLPNLKTKIEFIKDNL